MRIINETNLAEVTAQEVFDFVTSCLLRQGRKSVNEIGMCQYRGVEDTKCAGGWLLSSKAYRRDIEGESWEDVIRLLDIPNKHYELIIKLQNVHDTKSVKRWREEFNKIAKEFSLEPIKETDDEDC